MTRLGVLKQPRKIAAMAHTACLGVLHPNPRSFIADQPGDQCEGIAQRRANEAHADIIGRDHVAHDSGKYAAVANTSKAVENSN